MDTYVRIHPHVFGGRKTLVEHKKLELFVKQQGVRPPHQQIYVDFSSQNNCYCCTKPETEKRVKCLFKLVCLVVSVMWTASPSLVLRT